MQSIKHISPRAEQLISEYNLGQVRAEYRENFLKSGLIFTAFLPVGLLVVSALALPTLLAPALTDGDWWQRMGNLFYFLMVGSFFLLVGATGVVILVITLWKGEKRLYLGDKGFVLARRQIEMVAYWDTVAEIHRHMLFVKIRGKNVEQMKSICSYTVISTKGIKCSFVAEPGPMIEEMVSAYQLPRMLEDYTSGKTLSFGLFALDSQGLYLLPEVVSTSNPTAMTKLPGIARTSQKLQGTGVESGEHFLPWRQLTCYWIDENHSTLILSRRGERKHWAIVPLYQIVNPALCLALIEYICYGDTREIA